MVPRRPVGRIKWQQRLGRLNPDVRALTQRSRYLNAPRPNHGFGLCQCLHPVYLRPRDRRPNCGPPSWLRCSAYWWVCSTVVSGVSFYVHAADGIVHKLTPPNSLSGAVFMQAVLYFRLYINDPARLKLLVYASYCYITRHHLNDVSSHRLAWSGSSTSSIPSWFARRIGRTWSRISGHLTRSITSHGALNGTGSSPCDAAEFRTFTRLPRGRLPWLAGL